MPGTLARRPRREQVGALQRVEVELATGQVGQLGLGAQGVAEADGVASQRVFALRVLPVDALDALAAPGAQAAHTAVHRHAERPQPGNVVQALGQHRGVAQQRGQGGGLVGQDALSSTAATWAPALAYW
jgi:hypothetical protein